MLLNRIFLLLLLGIGLASPALATVDVLHANNINKKLYYFEEGLRWLWLGAHGG